ncbi:hypothetical protein Fleli_2626 [Bernardetia litoralis DSM 6794]|uniref:DUF3575 domain-containing protein n=1 Tax=Bernardetia litoralis (strain ATCC 23117 / DSM 6794 / NBRC 15988 / NCIMB 1366 / Fx l1 / Sio-4) TaxID=880071 RepID=I4AM03_BERLS|nr:hypothetical protein [Bernardetia litoralis]AFM04988.1 hypothetical protein Fleli_2626 [Bernardetia litoralis DSM 6794]
MKQLFLSKLFFKGVFFLLFLSVYSYFNLSKGQQTEQQTNQKQFVPPKKTAISFVPTYIFRSTLQIGIQRFNKYQDRSFVLYGGITGLSNEFLKENGYTAEAQYRFYVKRFKVRTNFNEKSYQQGIYVGIWARGEQFEQNYDYENISYFDNTGRETILTYKGTRNIEALSGGIQFGFQQTFAEYFFIDLYVGGGYRGTNIDTQNEVKNTDKPQHKEIMRWHNGIFDRGYQGVLPRAGFGLGVIF